MIISRNWLNEWVDLKDISDEILLKTLNSIGLEVDNYSKITIPNGVVVGYVKSKVKHENSDHLNVCEVDIGSQVLQIVCGAKNVAPNQYVPVATIGTTMPNGLEIKKSKLRGVDSNGMICSSSELGLAKTNDGIMVLDDSIGELKLGTELALYPLLNDSFIEIELTANRGDCLSIHGIARDLSAALNLSMREKVVFHEPENLLGIGRILTIKTDEKIKSNFQFKAISVKQQVIMPLIINLRLASVGIKKQDEIENFLEYATHSTGVLFRAYDVKKLPTIDEKLAIEIKENNDFYTISSNDKIMSYAGVYQTDIAKTDEQSRYIIIEANYNDPEQISIAINKHKDINKDEHSYRSTRGSEPDLNFGLNYLFNMFSHINTITAYAGSHQILSHTEPKIATFSLDEIYKMIGEEIPKNEIIKILKKLDFEVNFNTEQKLMNVKIPKFRHDIANSHDICEEIIRMVGIDNIAGKPLQFIESNRINSALIEYKNKTNLRKKAVANGFFECISYIFDNSKELTDLGFLECKAKIINPINNELNTLRPTIINHLLKVASNNIKNYKKSIRLFEIGKVFNQDAKELEKLSIIHSGLLSDIMLSSGVKPSPVSFLKFASSIQNIIGKFSLEPRDDIKFLSSFEQANIIQNGKIIGFLGRVDINYENKLDLPTTYICEIDFEKICFDIKIAKEYSKQPAVSRDLTILIPNEMRFSTVKSTLLDKINISQLKEFIPIDIYKDSSLQDKYSLSLKFTFQDMQNSLTDEQVNIFMDNILKVLNDIGINLR